VISLLRLWLNKLLHLRAAKVSVRNVIIIDDLFVENADMDSCQIQCVLKTMQPIGHLRVPVLEVYMAAISASMSTPYFISFYEGTVSDVFFTLSASVTSLRVMLAAHLYSSSLVHSFGGMARLQE